MLMKFAPKEQPRSGLRARTLNI